jgi:hypothetical protein
MKVRKCLLSLGMAAAISISSIGFGGITEVHAADGVEINATNFPDANFRSYVSDNFDKDKNGFLSNEEISSVSSIFVYFNNISDLTGI